MINIDKRYIALKNRLMILTEEELTEIIDNSDLPYYNHFNLKEIDKGSPDRKASSKIDFYLNPTNILKDIDGDFFTTNKKDDLIKLCKDVISRGEASKLRQSKWDVIRLPTITMEEWARQNPY